jgi:hypothetical protein
MASESPRETRSAPNARPTPRPIDSAALLRQLAQLREREETQRRPDTTWAPVLHAAATLVAFEPPALWSAFGMPADAAATDWLHAHAEPVHGSGDAPAPPADSPPDSTSEGLWRLTVSERRSALRSATSREQLRAARRRAGEPTGASGAEQRMADALLFGTLGELADLSVGELAAALVARGWYEGALPGLPDEAALRARLALAQLLEPLRRLVGRHFVGRTYELARLADYVGVLGPQKVAGLEFIGVVRRGLRRARRSLIDNPPLYVSGPGGVGKSSLVARFILDHMDAPQQPGALPFVLLDFDRAQVEPRLPLSLLVAALQQLRVQFPSHAEAMQRMAQRLVQLMRSSDAAELSKDDSSQAVLVRDFAEQIDTMVGDEETPLLWVLDTFEEPQRLGESTVGPLWELMNTLQQSLPRLRLVVCGRVVPPGFKWDVVALEDFDEPSAKAYLQRRIAEAKANYPSDDESLGQLIKVVGRTPLALRLAARLLASEDKEILNLRMRRERIQAVLFHRVLDHIRIDRDTPLAGQRLDGAEQRRLEDELRRLVYPGLAVRRITPGVIEQVLADPCEVPLRDPGHAARLFAALAQQVDIVEPDNTDDGERSLLHRTDVRRMMLRDLEQKAGEALIRRIDRRAVRYHAGITTLAHCAEEIYHRLRLGQGEATIRDRWEEGLDRYLRPALDEISAPATRVMLAELLGVTLDAQALEGAEHDAWERQAARRSADYLRASNPERALSVLHERSERVPASPLLRLEVQALLQIGEFDAAATRAEQALHEAAEAGEQAAAADAALLLAQAEEALGGLERAATRAQEAGDWADALGEIYLVLRARISALRLARKRGAPEDVLAARAQAIGALLDSETLRGLRSRSALLRELLAELGGSHARLLRTGLEVLGVDLSSAADAEALAGTLTRWSDDLASVPLFLSVVSSFGLDFNPQFSMAKPWADWLWRASPKDIGSLLLRLLKEVPPAQTTKEALADLFRRDVDRRLTRRGRERAV